jgi:phosphoribosylformimino-5-aminoimidazole carboxamide ribotide isomerase
MYPLPAIDIRDGRCVRLLQGDFARETIYGDPFEQAIAFVDQGASMLHIVDLDAARSGEATNDAVIRRIVDRVGVPVQIGGGVRDRVRALDLLSGGVARVVIGTLAVERSDIARDLAEEFPEQIVLGLDHRTEIINEVAHRYVAVRGWERSGGIELFSLLQSLEDAPFAGVVVTDISRDGTLLGPDVDGYREILKRTHLPVIASGGVGTLEDLVHLAKIDADGRSLAGVIIGRALLSGAFTVAEAVMACAL